MNTKRNILIIGAGPAGLCAAETLAQENVTVTLYDRMPTPGRKFLMAGHGGLNLTNAEPLEKLLTRYQAPNAALSAAIQAFPPEKLRAWADGLGQETFVGTSGRVFPKTMKAASLMKAWRERLEKQGVSFVLNTRWLGWNEDGSLQFENESGIFTAPRPDALLIALGGVSWPELGSDGAWIDFFQKQKIPFAPFEPANCGFIAPWSAPFAEKFAGHPLKPVTLSFADRTIQGELTITSQGFEGGPIYALSGLLRQAIQEKGEAFLHLDLRPSFSQDALAKRLSVARGSQSFATFLRKAGGLSPEAIGLLRESAGPHEKLPGNPQKLAALIKALPVRLTATADIERAISCAGGVKFEALDEHFMLRAHPGVFLAGEMLDWDAPTGGYLLQACFSTGFAAASGLWTWLSGMATKA